MKGKWGINLSVVVPLFDVDCRLTGFELLD